MKKKDIKNGRRRRKKVGPTIVAKVQRVLDHVVVIPHIQQVVSRVVIHCSDVLVGIGERYVNRHLFALISVVHVVDFVPRPFIVIIFIDSFHHVQDSADHESIGGRAFVIAGVPRAFNAQGIRVELAHHDAPVVLLCCIDHPQSVLVHRQVNVRLAPPAVRRGVMVVGVGNNGLTTLDASAQVKLYNVAGALLVEEQCAIVDDKTSAIHTMWEFVGGGGTACNEVLL